MNDLQETALLNDIAQLEQALARDSGGERAGAMLKYFDGLARESVALQAGAADDADRRKARALAEAFEAARRVVAHVWEAQHGTPLVA